MTHLSVNLNKIALLRNSRGRNYPRVEDFAEKCLKLGAMGVTIHPRPDKRHATYEDITSLKKIVSKYPGKELNVEGYPSPDFIKAVIRNKPHQCTLVPDKPGQLTSDHGWNLAEEGSELKSIIASLRNLGVRVSLFLDPILEMVQLAEEFSPDRIELYTEEYAEKFGSSDANVIWEKYRDASLLAQRNGIEVNAGHDLNLQNLAQFIKIAEIKEVSIGHALVVEALEMGFENTIQSYLEILKTQKSPSSIPA